VSAWVGGMPCGRGRTLEIDEEVIYMVDVFAEWPGSHPGCGLPGRVVTFQVGTQPMAAALAWDNSQVWHVALGAGHRIYLPLVVKQ
jgi:hypothetical protein